MKQSLWVIVVAFSMLGTIYAETEITPKMESISLFKNGLAVVKESIAVNAPGRYVYKHVPEPVHGTFWIESNSVLSARVTEQIVEEPLENPGMDMQSSYAGKKVKISFQAGEQVQTIKGTVLPRPVQKEKNWNKDYRPRNYYYSSYLNIPAPDKKANRYLSIKTQTGVMLLDSSRIIAIEGKEFSKTRRVKKAVLILDVQKVESNSTVKISYLTKGLSWVPSYRVDIQDDKTLTIQQKAVIKNEFANFANTRIYLISGFPNVKFAHVTSPLSLQTSWSEFFRQLNQRDRSGPDITSNLAVQTQSVSPSFSSSGGDLDKSGYSHESVDIHYQDAGCLSMNKGDSMVLMLQKKTSRFEQVVEWFIPDSRQPNGRQINAYQRRNNPELYQESVWDCIQFKNPYSFPMTTGSVVIFRNGKFMGETISYWTSPGSNNTLKITKALSISTVFSEQEVKGSRIFAWISGDKYQKTEVESILKVKNLRSKAVKLLIRRQFSGELREAEDYPKCELRKDGVYSVNKRNELIWELNLNSGEEKRLTCKYNVLVDI